MVLQNTRPSFSQAAGFPNRLYPLLQWLVFQFISLWCRDQYSSDWVTRGAECIFKAWEKTNHLPWTWVKLKATRKGRKWTAWTWTKVNSIKMVKYTRCLEQKQELKFTHQPNHSLSPEKPRHKSAWLECLLSGMGWRDATLKGLAASQAQILRCKTKKCTRQLLVSTRTLHPSSPLPRLGDKSLFQDPSFPLYKMSW